MKIKIIGTDKEINQALNVLSFGFNKVKVKEKYKRKDNKVEIVLEVMD